MPVSTRGAVTGGLAATQAESTGAVLGREAGAVPATGTTTSAAGSLPTRDSTSGMNFVRTTWQRDSHHGAAMPAGGFYAPPRRAANRDEIWRVPARRQRPGERVNVVERKRCDLRPWPCKQYTMPGRRAGRYGTSDHFTEPTRVAVMFSSVPETTGRM